MRGVLIQSLRHYLAWGRMPCYTSTHIDSQSKFTCITTSSPTSPWRSEEKYGPSGHVCSCGVSAMEPPGWRSPWPRAPMGGRPVAGPAVVAASAAGAGAARAGPPRHAWAELGVCPVFLGIPKIWKEILVKIYRCISKSLSKTHYLNYHLKSLLHQSCFLYVFTLQQLLYILCTL